jgi:hypothetical protein
MGEHEDSQGNHQAGSSGDEAHPEEVQPAGEVPPLSREAYLKHLEEMKAIPDDKLIPVTLIVNQTTTRAMGSLPAIQRLRPQMIEELPKLNIKQIDTIEEYALALAYAQSLHMGATTTPEDLDAMIAEASVLRSNFLSDARSLANRNHLDRKKLTRFKNAPGHSNMATEVMGLAAILLEAWPTVSNKTGTTPEELQRANYLGTRILRAVSVRDRDDAPVPEETLRRQQAFTLLVKAYGQARRATVYLRDEEGDADELVPSLYAGRTSGSHKGDKPAPADPAHPAGSASPEHPAEPADSEHPADPAEPVLPGGNPFLKK